MERLQAAIEKARAARAKDPTRTPPAAVNRQALPTLILEPNHSNWDDLEKLRIDKKRLQKRRIAALDGGQETAPFDLLRTRILQQAAENGWKRIGILSPHSNCGKSTITLNLAFSLARQREDQEQPERCCGKCQGKVVVPHQHSCPLQEDNPHRGSTFTCTVAKDINNFLGPVAHIKGEGNVEDLLGGPEDGMLGGSVDLT